jgi:hypothetical protein
MLSECEQCKREFLPAFRGQDCCSKKCTREKKLAERNRSHKRTTVLASGSKKDPGFSSGDLLCQAPWCTEPMVHDHHVIAKQHVERLGGGIWDPRNALGVCFHDHGTHHKQIKKLPISCLHDRNFDFAYELMGLAATDYLRRHYAGDDERIASYEARVKYGVPFDG